MKRQLAVVAVTVLVLGAFLGIIQQQVAADLGAGADDVQQELVAAPRADRVDFTWTLTNEGDATLRLQYGYGDVDFIVRQDGETVWRWSDDRVFILVLLTRDLKPGEQLELRGYWEQPAPGAYTVEATFSPHSGPELSAGAVDFMVSQADVLRGDLEGDASHGQLLPAPDDGDRIIDEGGDDRIFDGPPVDRDPSGSSGDEPSSSDGSAGPIGGGWPGDAGSASPDSGQLDAAVSGDRVDFTWILSNETGETLHLEYGYGDIEFVVQHVDGQEVWRWTAGQVFPDVLILTELAPGETLELTGSWEGAEHGLYVVEASFEPLSGPGFAAIGRFIVE